MASKTWVVDAGDTPRLLKRWAAVDAGSVTRFAKRVFVIDAGGTARLVFAQFVGPIIHVYSTAQSLSEVILQGASNLVIEGWGGCGAGGGGFSKVVGGETQESGGGGGGPGGYFRSSFALTSVNWGQTISAIIGAGCTPSQGIGQATVISSGTFSLSTMTGGGGLHGGNAPSVTVGGTGSASGSGSGGNQANLTGGTGTNGQNNAAGGAFGIGGTGVTGVHGTGPNGGNGSTGFIPGNTGRDGMAIFYYT
jgi:hypothetical protein